MKIKNLLKMLLALTLIGSLLCGCRGMGSDDENSSEIKSDSEKVAEEKNVEYKEVTFRNEYAQFVDLGIEATANRIDSSYDNASNEKLYAFCVNLEYNSAYEEMDHSEREQIQHSFAVETARAIGLMVLSDYPYDVSVGNNEAVSNPQICLCVVVGTMEQIVNLFNETSAIEGEYWKLDAAPRPDWSDIMLEAGWNGNDEMHIESVFYGKNVQAIEKLLGADAEVTLTVPVIMSE